MPYKHLQTESLIILLRQIECNSNYKLSWPYHSVCSWLYIVNCSEKAYNSLYTNRKRTTFVCGSVKFTRSLKFNSKRSSNSILFLKCIYWFYFQKNLIKFFLTYNLNCNSLLLNTFLLKSCIVPACRISNFRVSFVRKPFMQNRILDLEFDIIKLIVEKLMILIGQAVPYTITTKMEARKRFVQSTFVELSLSNSVAIFNILQYGLCAKKTDVIIYIDGR